MTDGNAFPAPGRRVWAVGALCRAVADALEARFNPVTVRGEITGFSRAASGHCYFSLKDAQGQVRCAMFRRSASLLEFLPRDGELVEVSGRLGVYEQRGDLQLVVESMRRAGQGALFEQFLRLKAKLEAEGLFDAARKRELPLLPRGIGIATSLGAAALHDVVTCLRRRAPHVPVVLVPAAVQGAQAPGELAAALESLYRAAERGTIDVILLVRGGGSMEDLWAFNDERLARTIVRSPVPLVSGVGHETDFTIADFCADVRAPTPTAAAELAAQPREAWLGALRLLHERLREAALRRLDRAAQRLDQAAAHLGRPSARTAQQHLRIERQAQRLRFALTARLQRSEDELRSLREALRSGIAERLARATRDCERIALRLQLLDPRLVLQRGYALLTDPASGQPLTSVRAMHPGRDVRAALADGEVDLRVATRGVNPS
ncbi:exodeoxyribonuclease VII large subunit [Ramlibacter monticola]|uniref:Exodeoxyribonuclease 7 large subunit n=1 Tax=Ramlibacter monticola TaxID=1926872 RepID=A0A936Z0I3_9BURK|nr:exodeoxyribonuclease VII large subunit [Ramlibacter monticola]MBL0391405.1 exodeoxyribonuclease VII large subunit [Ramlibacter monticola]